MTTSMWEQTVATLACLFRDNLFQLDKKRRLKKLVCMTCDLNVLTVSRATVIEGLYLARLKIY
jgi:hypothetical protein